MRIKHLYKEYIQKSRVFLYPALRIKRGVSVTPVCTYISWAGMYTEDDCRFIVVYHMREDYDFKLFEEVKLLGNPLFEKFFKLENGDGAYVFNFETHAEDFSKVVEGKYSKLSEAYKKIINEFYKNHQVDKVYMESWLYPESFYNDYAQLLGVEKRVLVSTVELWSKPDLTQECLKIKVDGLKETQFELSLT